MHAISSLAVEFEEIARHKDVGWAQRSKGLWLKKGGDRYIKFFHRTENSHTRYSNIVKLIEKIVWTTLLRSTGKLSTFTKSYILKQRVGDIKTI